MDTHTAETVSFTLRGCTPILPRRLEFAFCLWVCCGDLRTVRIADAMFHSSSSRGNPLGPVVFSIFFISGEISGLCFS